MDEDPKEPVTETKVTVTAMPGRVRGARRRKGPSSVPAPIDVVPGDRIDRYVVVGTIGAGGMGVVFKAVDPDLDRPVAIKLLRPGGGADSSEGRARLVREGQAIARLAHPNVVTVHDIGVVRDDLCFVAMEYVEGRSLRQWLDAGHRTAREIVDVFVQAGKGLAAAHAKGIVHRDFKPDNVLVGDDGRVRVADFGLARADDDFSSSVDGRGSGEPARRGAPAPASGPPAPAVDRGSPARTADASPAAAPPAFTAGLPVDTELATGEPIASGATPVRSGLTPDLDTPLTRPGHVMGTPAFMAPEQHRGGRGDARSDQFAFCVALYQALCRQHPFKHLPRMQATEDPPATPQPMPPAARIPAWLERVVRRGLASAPAARFPSMDALLAELERDRGRARRLALVGSAVLGAVGAGVAVAATVLPAHAPPRCQGADAMFDAVWNDGARQQVRAAFVATARPNATASFARIAGLLDDYGAEWTAMSTASCQATQVHGIQSEHVLDLRTACLDRRLSEVRALVGVLTRELDPAQLDRAVQAAYGLTPLASCAPGAALEAAVPPPTDPRVRQRVDELRAELDRASALQSTGAYGEAMTIAQTVAAAADGLDYGPLEAEAQLQLGAIQQRNGAPRPAEDSLQRALAAASAAKDSMLVARTLSELVWVVGYQQARYDEGIAYFQSASAALSLAGGDAIVQAQLLKNVGGVYFDQGDYAAARRHYEEGSAVLARTLGAEHPYVATALNNVGTVLLAQGNAAEALPYFERGLAVGEKTLGPEHPLVTDYLNNIGAALGDQDKVAEARPYYLRALASLEKTLGTNHPDLGYPLFNIGVGYVNEHDCAAAIPYFERALAVREAGLGADHPHVAYPLTGLGRCRLELGQAAAAIALFERAARILEVSGSDPTALASAHFDLAQALWEAGQDRPRARALATAARRVWADAPRWAEELATVEAWLRAHRR